MGYIQRSLYHTPSALQPEALSHTGRREGIKDK